MGNKKHKILRRQDITFEEKDQSLRDDVRMLGALLYRGLEPVTVRA